MLASLWLELWSVIYVLLSDVLAASAASHRVSLIVTSRRSLTVDIQNSVSVLFVDVWELKATLAGYQIWRWAPYSV